jgi:prepilin-type N-terminal cleavage/methylation domain-containing protein
MFRASRAFTLIELLAVIAVLAILTGIVIAARGAPFNSPAELISSGLLQAAFDATPNRITTMTAQQFLDDVAPILAARSDTFKIRAYGDSMNPADAVVSGAKPEAVAYCEAVVQRTSDDDPLGNGKKFVITYFRWLGPDDI